MGVIMQPAGHIASILISAEVMITGFRLGKYCLKIHWVYLTATFDRDGLEKVYYNGKEKASISMAPASAVSWLNEPFRVACGTNGSVYQPHKGYIDDVRVFDRVLSADEVAELYETTR
jgi:hypothetical protein